MHLNRSDVIIVQLSQFSNDIFSYIVKPNLIRLFPTGGSLVTSSNWRLKIYGLFHKRSTRKLSIYI